MTTDGAVRSRPARAPRILREEGGAIMVMGVFLSCSLIAMMWFMMGIGDAILWRDRSQEAADAIAYTSAAVHARGMNFISAINIIMLIIVTIYIVMCIARSVLDLLLYISGDPWEDTCKFWSDLFDPEDTTGHGLFSFAGAIPGLEGFGLQHIKFIAGGDPARYRRGNWAGLWGPVSDVDAWGTGAGLRDYVVNIGKCSACVTSLVQIVTGIIGAPATIGAALAAAAAGLVQAAITCYWCYRACKSTHPFQLVAEPAAKTYHVLEGTILPGYENFMKVTLPPMHEVEKVTAKVFPWVGAVAGAYAGYTYTERMTWDPSKQVHHLGLALSPTMFPDLKPNGQQKEMKPSCADTKGKWPSCIEYIKYKGNGCGPTLCNDGKTSHSGAYRPCTNPDPKQCDGRSSSGNPLECCEMGTPGCTWGNGAATVCNQHGGVAADQTQLYQNRSYNVNKRYGLPVEAEDMNELCFKSTAYIGEFIGGLFAQVPGISQALALSNKIGSVVSKIPGLGGVGNLLSDPIGAITQAMAEKMKVSYCVGDDEVGFGQLDKRGPSQGARHIHEPSKYKVVLTHDFWYTEPDDAEKKGPMKVVPYAKNGNDWMQVYSIVFPQYYNLTTKEYGNPTGNWAKLRLAVGPKESGKSQYDDNQNGPLDDAVIFYVSEAEFYHDCEGKWDDQTCNGMDHSVYRLNWRARLRRVHKPQWMQDMIAKVPGITQINQATGVIVKNQAQIAQVVADITGLNIQGPLTVIEYLNGLSSQGQGNLWPTMIH